MNYTLPASYSLFSVDSAQQRFYAESAVNGASAVCRVNGVALDPSQVKFTRVLAGNVLDHISVDFIAALALGNNLVTVEVYDALGVVIDTATATAVYSAGGQIASGIQPPSNLSFYEYNAQIKLFWDLTELTNVSFFNVYRSVDPNLSEENWVLLTTIDITNYATTSVEDVQSTTETVDPSNGDIVRTQKIHPVPVFRFGALLDLDAANLDKDQFFVVSSSYRVGSEIFESRYSAPIQVRSFTVPAANKMLPVPTIRELTAQYIDQLPSAKGAVDSKGHTVDVLPESPLMATQIAPVSMFLNRLYTLDEFRDKVDNIVLLVRLDDANGDGVSDDPNTGEKLRYATVLNIPSTTLQSYIDQAFDRHAARESLTRAPASVGTATLTLTWQTDALPSPIAINQSTQFVAPRTLTGATQDLTFVSMTTLNITSQNVASFYQPSLGLYQTKIRVQSQNTGAVYNVPAASITRFANSPAIPIEVTNEDTVTDAGDSESNASLADRILASRRGAQISSRFWLDQKVLNNSSVKQRHIIRAGDPYMLRDFDFIRGISAGGMADVCVSSEDSQTFSEAIALNTTFTIKGNIFSRKAVDQVSPPTPPETAPFFGLIIPQPDFLQFLRAPVIGAVTSIYNVPRGIDYMGTGPGQIEIIENRFIRINAIQTDSLTPWTDGEEVNVVLTLVADTFLLRLTKPPVLSVADVVDEAGTSVIAKAELIHLSPPYLEGNSSMAQDYVLLTNYTSSVLRTIDEGKQTLRKDQDYFLTKKGVQVPTLDVRYLGASLTAGTDYFVTYHEDTDQVSIRLASGYSVSTIETDATGGISYTYNENLTVVYNYDSAVQKIQNQIWEEDIIGKRNLLVKRSSPLQISFEAQISLYDLGKTADTDILVRSALSQFETSIPLSNKIYQSEIVTLAESVANVAKVDIPLLHTRYYQSVFDYYPISLEASGGLSYVGPYWDLQFPRVDLTKDFHFWGGRQFYEVKNSDNLAKVEGTYYFFGGVNFGVQQYQDLTAPVFEQVPDALRCLSFLRADSSLRQMSNSTVMGSDYAQALTFSAATTAYMAFDAAACDMAGYYGVDDYDAGYLTTTTANPPAYDGETSLAFGTGTRPRPAWIRNDKSWVDTGMVIYGGSSGASPMKVFRKFFASTTAANPYFPLGGTQARGWVYGLHRKVTFSGGVFTVDNVVPHNLVDNDDIVITRTTENAMISAAGVMTVTTVSPTVFSFPGAGSSTHPYWFIDWQRHMASHSDDLFNAAILPYSLIFADDVWGHYALEFEDAQITVVSGKVILTTPTDHGFFTGQYIDVTKTSLSGVLPLNPVDSPYLVEVISSTQLRLYATNVAGTPTGLCNFRLAVKATHAIEEYRLRFNPYYDKFTHLPVLPTQMVASFTVKDSPIDLEDYFVPRNQPVRFSQVVINYREETSNTNSKST